MECVCQACVLERMVLGRLGAGSPWEDEVGYSFWGSSTRGRLTFLMGRHGHLDMMVHFPSKALSHILRVEDHGKSV